MLSWPHSGFSVHAAVRAETRDDASRLGRYMIRCPLVLDRLEWDKDRWQLGQTQRWRQLEDLLLHLDDQHPRGAAKKPEKDLRRR